MYDMLQFNSTRMYKSTESTFKLHIVIQAGYLYLSCVCMKAMRPKIDNKKKARIFGLLSIAIY